MHPTVNHVSISTVFSAYCVFFQQYFQLAVFPFSLSVVIPPPFRLGTFLALDLCFYPLTLMLSGSTFTLLISSTLTSLSRRKSKCSKISLDDKLSSEDDVLSLYLSESRTTINMQSAVSSLLESNNRKLARVGWLCIFLPDEINQQPALYCFH